MARGLLCTLRRVANSVAYDGALLIIVDLMLSRDISKLGRRSCGIDPSVQANFGG